MNEVYLVQLGVIFYHMHGESIAQEFSEEAESFIHLLPSISQRRLN